jgi:hypothetical protein
VETWVSVTVATAATHPPALGAATVVNTKTSIGLVEGVEKREKKI